METIKTLKLRNKDKHAPALVAMACEVNQVWNYVNELSSRSIRERQKWLSAYDLQKYTAGYSKCDGVKVGSATVQLICEEYAARRKQFKKARLNWRVSNQKSPKRSLGWIPFKNGGAVYRNGQVKFCGLMLGLWDSYGLSKYELRAGSISQDARGRWYFNVAVYVEVAPSAGTASIGIDLGLKTTAVCSNGQSLASRTYRKYEPALAIAQRARKKGRTRAIHAKIANVRKDSMHKFSTRLVAENAAIFVGNVSSKALIKTKMAKSTLDAGWSMFKTILKYKSHQAGIVFEEVNESYTTQTCSCCGVIPASSPKGRAELGIREWACSNCGSVHHRDTNAAKNILARGHSRLAVGIPSL